MPRLRTAKLNCYSLRAQSQQLNLKLAKWIEFNSIENTLIAMSGRTLTALLAIFEDPLAQIASSKQLANKCVFVIECSSP